MEELNSVRAKWYDIGMQLGVSIGSLDGIKKQYNDPSDCLRETLKIWLETNPSPTVWSNIVNALSSNTVGKARLAAYLEHKFCPKRESTTTATHLLEAMVPPVIPPPQSTVACTHSLPLLPPPFFAPYYYTPPTGYPRSGAASTATPPTILFTSPQVTPGLSQPIPVPSPSTPLSPTLLLTHPTIPQLPSLSTVTSSPQYSALPPPPPSLVSNYPVIPTSIQLTTVITPPQHEYTGMSLASLMSLCFCRVQVNWM